MKKYEEMTLEERAEAAAAESVAHAQSLAASVPEALDWAPDELPGAETEGEGESGPYDGMTNDELREVLRERELETSGNKDELLARLAESDATEG